MASQDVDAWFADAHLDFLIRFTEYEELELNRLIARTTDATQNEDEYQTKILVENVAKEKAEADKRVEEVTHRVGHSLERDARGAAKNLAYGLKRAGCDAKEFKKKMNESVTQVEITIAKALDEIYGGNW